MIFKKQATLLGVLLFTMSPLLAEGGVLDWIEGKTAQNTNDPCLTAFPGMNLESDPDKSNACWGCPAGHDGKPDCSGAVKLNPCQYEKIKGVWDKENKRCTVCLPNRSPRYGTNGAIEECI